VELLVAIAIAGAVVVMGHRIVAGAVDALDALHDRREAVDREANARRILAALVASIDMRAGGIDQFNGEPSRLAFPSWIDDAHGWPVRRDVTLVVSNDTLVAHLTGVRFPLLPNVRRMDVDYLLTTGANERWVRTWMTSSSVPLAIRLRLHRTDRADTLLLVIGTRG
jgi:hypothetical protein